MRVKVEHDGYFLPTDVKDAAVDIVTKSLQGITTVGGQFIVNDTLCFRKQRTGRITTCVMNSAPFLSKKFQHNLAQFPGCQGETKIEGQDIDGLITRTVKTVGYRIKDKDRLLEVLHRYIEENGRPDGSIYTLFPMFYGMYTERGLYDIECLPEDVKDLFEAVPGEKQFTLGVEFETGNVASSFRALNKLFVLFQRGVIDAGILVTSTDKQSSATRIWPVSNRNGSLQELRQRHYLDQVSLPLISVGFAPDGFDPSAPYLGRNGGLYRLKPTGKQDSTGDYEIFVGEDGEEILKPIGM